MSSEHVEHVCARWVLEKDHTKKIYGNGESSQIVSLYLIRGEELLIEQRVTCLDVLQIWLQYSVRCVYNI